MGATFRKKKMINRIRHWVFARRLNQIKERKGGYIKGSVFIFEKLCKVIPTFNLGFLYSKGSLLLGN